MKRFRAFPPGAFRLSRVFRSRDGLIVPRGMLAVRKESRREREVNRRARRAVAAGLERDLGDTLASFRASIPSGEIQQAVFGGSARVIVNAAEPNELEAELIAVLEENIELAVEQGARVGFRFAPPSLGTISPGAATDAAAAFIQRQAASSALGITQATQAGIQEVLEIGIRGALAPVDVAKKVGDLAGLLPQQVRAVENFRTATTARFVPTGEALTPQVQRVIDQEVDRFRDRQILSRGRLIADTETQAAITSGEREFWDEAVRQGAVEPELLFKTWRTVLDSRVCPICEPLHGQVVKFDVPFMTSVGGKAGPPAHPRCRCYLEYGEESPESGRRPDRGAEAVRAAENRRLLDPDTLQEDFAISLRREERTRDRLRRAREGSRGAERIEASLASATATSESLRARLRSMGLET